MAFRSAACASLLCIFLFWGAWLCRPSDPVRSAAPLGWRPEAIVVLAGSYEERVAAAARLFRSSPGGVVVLANDGVGAGWSQKYQRCLRSIEQIEEALVQRGVPREAIVRLPFVLSGTVYDALLAREFALKARLRRLLVVTSDYHVPRAAWTFRRVFEGTDVEAVVVAADAAGGHPWARMLERVKGGFYAVRYGLFGLPEVRLE